MKVTFTKFGGRRYVVAVEREQGPPLVPRGAPGYDDHMPHDLAHYVVEEQRGLALGVFGQLAVGGGGLFVPAPADRSEEDRRRVRRVAADGRPDMISFRECRPRPHGAVAERGRSAGPVAADHDGVVTPAEVERVVARIDELSARWHALPDGGSLVLDRPATVSGSRSAPTRRRAPR